jgi:hypothetical protein
VQTSETQQKSEVDFPLWALPQFRQEMATLLMEHDGSEPIDEMPTIPEWATRRVDYDVQTKRLDLFHPKNWKSIRFASRLYIAIDCQEGGKFLKIYKWRVDPSNYICIVCIFLLKFQSEWPGPKYLPDILVPEGAYKIVAAIDEGIRHFPTEEPTHSGTNKLGLLECVLHTQIGLDQYVFDGAILFHYQEGDESPYLETQIGDYKFKFSTWHKKGHKWHLCIHGVPTSEEDKHTEQKLYILISALPELRQQMVKILAEHGGSERIDEMPTIPEWATRGFSQIQNSRTINLFTFTHQSAAPKIEQQEQQPNVEQEADDAHEDCPYSLCTKKEKCWRCTPPSSSSKLTKRR